MSHNIVQLVRFHDGRSRVQRPGVAPAQGDHLDKCSNGVHGSSSSGGGSGGGGSGLIVVMVVVVVVVAVKVEVVVVVVVVV